MKHIDHNSNFDRLALPGNAQYIARATINNRRIFNGDEVSETPFTTGALKYGNKNKTRARYRPLSEINSKYDTAKAKTLLKLLGHYDEDDEDEPRSLKFQLDSWRQINNQNGLRIARNDHKGLVISAPTGFGKTACFIGGTLNKILNGNSNRALFVYPSKALLRDQLSRILKTVDVVRSSDEFDQSLSVGLWHGRQPYSVDQIFDESKYNFVRTDDAGNRILKVANHWDDEVADQRLHIERKGSNGYEVRHPETNLRFDHSEFVLNRKKAKDDGVGPEIILTTLESLELIGLKPHYDILQNTDFIVFDEVHQYTGLRGSHAARIVRNLKEVMSDWNESLLLIGSSATLENPERFGRQLFGFEEDEDLTAISPGASDTIETDDDLEKPYVPDEILEKERPDNQHFYFMLTPEGGPGVASQYIQHAMMVGHALSRDESGTHSKMLSFIDSKSQLNQIETQIENADRTQELWKLHRNIDDAGDWGDLAAETGHSFYDDYLSVASIYSGSATGMDDIVDADVIQSTKLLEVGIDIGDLSYISQYRPPQNISSFMQRAGRAGRKPGMDSHTFVLLSKYGGDENFYYRASRFLERDITTPLRPDNHVAEWIHRNFLRYFRTLRSFKNTSSGWWSEADNQVPFFRAYFDDELGWGEFETFLTETSDELEAIFDEPCSFNGDLFDESDEANPVVEDVREYLDGIKREIDEELDELAKHTTGDVDDLLQGDLDVHAALDDFRTQLREYLTELEDVARDIDASDELELIETARETISESDDDEFTERYNALDETRAHAGKIRGDLDFELTREPDASATLPNREVLTQIENGLKATKQCHEEGNLTEYRKRFRQVYYLRRALEEVEDYNKLDIAPHGSLFHVKSLFRAAYYHTRCRNVTRDDRTGTQLSDAEDDRVWYVPPNYFSDAGRYFKLKSEYYGYNSRDVSLESLLSQYAPFNEEYVSSDGAIHLHQPRIEGTGDDARIDFSDVIGYEHKEVKIPEEIELKKVDDLSGDEGRDILAYDSETFTILENNRSRCPGGRDAKAYGSLYSTPTIATSIENPQWDRNLKTVKIGDVDAKAWIDRVTLEIQPAKKMGNRYFPDSDAETQEHTLETTDTKLGYVLETRGIQWDLSQFVAKLRDESLYPNRDESVVERVRRYKGEDTSIDNVAEIALNTAARYLTLLVSDVSGINPQMLLYVCDEDDDSVYVFEQTEGGQGLVDYFGDEVQQNPGNVLQSSYSLVHNPQILCERVWQHRSTVQELLDTVSPGEIFDAEDIEETELDETLRNLISSQLEISFIPSIKRIRDEMIAILETLEDLATQTDDVSRDELYELKQFLSRKRVEGESWEDVTEQLIEDGWLSGDLEATTVESVLWSPDVDDCKANLELPNTIANTTGTDTVSFECLQALQDHIITPVEKGNSVEELKRRKVPWARSIDEDVLFLEL